MNLKQLKRLHSLYKSPELKGRYITNFDIEKCLNKYSDASYSVIGSSVEDRSVYALKFGSGKRKVLLWSQMHGNESTTTKALFDCFNLFFSDDILAKSISESCTILAIPILNPDGAERYTRLNANSVDLNRDAQELSQPESKILRDLFNDFKPDYCFNLHGQRTIYNVSGTANSSVLSFLSPAQDKDRKLTTNRKVAMSIIASIAEALQVFIPNGVARYDDGFNINCVGDTFQYLGVPTILFEAGHYPNDYNREEVRHFMFIAILKALGSITNGIDTRDYKDYFKIPENAKQFYDIIIRNARLEEESTQVMDIGIQYQETLINHKVDFIPKVEVISILNNFYGHKEIDAKQKLVKGQDGTTLKVANENDFVLINNEKISLKP
ncbi:M14 family metallopeptidase [Winogradskyella aquimaris]|uniref:M14 family metallopeptidase n=1 Tax=Winogradskyella aquimaris TaxID=864074 RepID=A0ABU5EMC2_9FLAO|nr:M14 metallopeptidase family protein [Winogradskyella aquimaris]MDY2586670.1 M14 family metallopeptidase [Winogradskyella aquimaris]